MDKPKYNEGMAVTYRLAQCGVGSGIIIDRGYSEWAKKIFYRVAFSEGIDYVWEDNIIV